MKEIILNYLHIKPLLLMIILSVSKQLWISNKLVNTFKKNLVSIQLLLISIGVLGGTRFHFHEGILGCNICLMYSILLVWIAFKLLYLNTNNFRQQS